MKRNCFMTTRSLWKKFHVNGPVVLLSIWQVDCVFLNKKSQVLPYVTANFAVLCCSTFCSGPALSFTLTLLSSVNKLQPERGSACVWNTLSHSSRLLCCWALTAAPVSCAGYGRQNGAGRIKESTRQHNHWALKRKTACSAENMASAVRWLAPQWTYC